MEPPADITHFNPKCGTDGFAQSNHIPRSPSEYVVVRAVKNTSLATLGAKCRLKGVVALHIIDLDSRSTAVNDVGAVALSKSNAVANIGDSVDPVLNWTFTGTKCSSTASSRNLSKTAVQLEKFVMSDNANDIAPYCSVAPFDVICVNVFVMNWLVNVRCLVLLTSTPATGRAVASPER